MHGVDSPLDGGRKGSAFLLALAPIHLIADAAEDRPALGIEGFFKRIRLAGEHVVRSGDPLGTSTTLDIGSRTSGIHLFGNAQDPSDR
jgi:hypothetical protein